MKELNARFTQQVKRTPTVASFRFVLDEKMGFSPGQFLEMVFDLNDRQNRALNKYLSFSSSPENPYIEVTKRLSNSLFSEKLKQLKVNDSVTIKAPLGNCVLDEKIPRIGFIAGGIGITPVISMVEYIVSRKLKIDVDLFYSNRNEEEIAFKEELDAWQAENNNLKVYYTVTECKPKDGTCYYGQINGDFLMKNACDIKEKDLFVFGPPAMVEAMYRLLLELGCNKESIKTEKFIGY